MQTTEQRTYRIADKSFYQTELVWGQIRWLHARVKGYPIHALKPEQVMDLLAGELSGILAIILIEAGTSPSAKVEAGLDAVRKLEAWLDATLRPEEAVPIFKDFFTSAQLPKLMEGLGGLMPKTMASAAPNLNAGQDFNGSRKPSKAVLRFDF